MTTTPPHGDPLPPNIDASPSAASSPDPVTSARGEQAERDRSSRPPVDVGFVGLGVMGAPMAAHLAAAGHTVTVYNRTTARASAWVDIHGGRAAPTPRQAAEGADALFVCVGNDDDVRSVVLGDDGALAGMPAGSVLVDHTTASAGLAHELAGAARARGVGFVDAPVSGGQAGAEDGRLTVMCGGEAGDFDRVQPLMACYGRAVTLLGPVGYGQLTKMVNQICIAGIVQGLAEGLDFGRRAGLDVDRVVSVISKGAAQSWQMDNRAATMARGEFDFGFAVEWMRKDLGICLEEARRSGARLPVTALVDQFYAHVEARGGRRWDTSSLIDLLRED
jgi:3-hydroxyisobutyrate dehydrogenase-like beta-hydroxyacid dehydrogenase